MNIIIDHNVSNNDVENKIMIMDFPLPIITKNSPAKGRELLLLLSKEKKDEQKERKEDETKKDNYPDAMEEYLRDVILSKFSTYVTLPSSVGSYSEINLNQLSIVPDNAIGSHCPRSKWDKSKYTIQQQESTKMNRWISESPVSTKATLEENVTTTLVNALSLSSSSVHSYFLRSNSNQLYQNTNRWSSCKSTQSDTLYTHQLIRPERLLSNDVDLNNLTCASSYQQHQEQERREISTQNCTWSNTLYTHQLIRPERLLSNDVDLSNLTCASSYQQHQEQERREISTQNCTW